MVAPIDMAIKSQASAPLGWAGRMGPLLEEGTRI
jgi:hypothetical protein